MEDVIKKAIEGGYHKDMMLCVGSDYLWHWQIAVLDPLFWQALDRERVEQTRGVFDQFTLQDWSGEGEVYDEIERLKNQVLTNIFNVEK